MTTMAAATSMARGMMTGGQTSATAANSFLQPFADFLYDDQPWSFFLTYRIQLAFACAALLLNLVFCIYAFSAGDCYNPHTTMWRTQLVIDVLVAVGYVLDSISAFRFQEPALQQPSAPPPIAVGTSPPPPSPSPSPLPPFANSTVADCMAQRPYLFILLICRQWAAILVFIMGLERLLFVCYPLWFRSIRVRKGPINVFTLFFALFAAGIAYTNAMYVSPDESVHFSCETTWAFGADYGWIYNGLVIVPQLLGCLFCSIAALLIHQERALRRFGGNRNKVMSEKRKIRKMKWILLSCLFFIAFPQCLLLCLHLLAPAQLFQLKLLIAQLFMTKCLGNLVIYRLGESRFGRGLAFMVNQWWRNRRKARVNPNDSVVTAVSYFVPRQ